MELRRGGGERWTRSVEGNKPVARRLSGPTDHVVSKGGGGGGWEGDDTDTLANFDFLIPLCLTFL